VRATIDLPDSVFRELKALAARRGMSIEEIVCLAIEEEIRKAERPPGHRLKFPILSSQQPGVLNLTNAEIENILS
jgi:hypothetical protein